MRNRLVLSILVAGLLAPAMPVASQAGEGPEYRRYRKAPKHVVRPRRDIEDEYAARANNLDPAGDYKGYPNWARVALSPKSDGRSMRR